MTFWKQFQRKFFSRSADNQFLADITNFVGSSPKNLSLYELATLHSSAGKVSEKGFRVSNERLEFLGDAVLSMVIAEFLFKKYPYKKEGFLTEIRSRIVKRDTLNKLAFELGVPELVELQDQKHRTRKNSIYGNALEAIIGAVYLDRGYAFCKDFILDKIVNQHLDLEEIINTESNYKSRVIEWAQKENKVIAFKSINEISSDSQKQFEVELLIDQQQISTGKGTSKKRAEQQAALKACQQLQLL